jgi:hypothetical protein
MWFYICVCGMFFLALFGSVCFNCLWMKQDWFKDCDATGTENGSKIVFFSPFAPMFLGAAVMYGAFVNYEETTPAHEKVFSRVIENVDDLTLDAEEGTFKIRTTEGVNHEFKSSDPDSFYDIKLDYAANNGPIDLIVNCDDDKNLISIYRKE